MQFQRQNYKEALGDVQGALDQVENASPRVKGLVLVGSGPVLAHYATTQADIDKIPTVIKLKIDLADLEEKKAMLKSELESSFISDTAQSFWPVRAGKLSLR